MCQFSYPFHYAAVWLISALAIIPAFFSENEDYKDRVTPMCLRISLPILFSLLLIIVIRMMYLFLYNFAAELNFIGRYEESLAIAEECKKSWNDYDVQFLIADNLKNIGQIDCALDVYQHALNMIPCRFEPLESMMTLYMEKGDTIWERKIAEIIITKPVKVQSFRVKQIKSLANHVLSNYEDMHE